MTQQAGSASKLSQEESNLTAHLTEDDVATLKRVFAKSTIEEVLADPDGLKVVSWTNRVRANGLIQGSLKKYIPAANLTDSDAALLEKLTGTSSIQQAEQSSADACSLMENIASARQDGSLTGDISATYLQYLLSASECFAASGSAGYLVSPAFVRKALASIQAVNPSPAPILDKLG